MLPYWEAVPSLTKVEKTAGNFPDKFLGLQKFLTPAKKATTPKQHIQTLGWETRKAAILALTHLATLVQCP